jgi:hypothetical protein
MTTTQRQRPQRPSAPAPNPASRGLILVVVAVVLGAILLIKGGGIGFDQSGEDLTIESEGDTPTEQTTTTTTQAAPSTSVAPAELTVVALNGAGINGYAASAQQFLSVAGYTSTTAATAATQATTTTIYYAPGYEADAMAIASLLGLDAGAVQPLPEGTQLARTATDVPADVDVVVLLGPDVQNLLQTSGAGTTTTVAGSTSNGTNSSTSNSSSSSGSSNTTTTAG